MPWHLGHRFSHMICLQMGSFGFLIFVYLQSKYKLACLKYLDIFSVVGKLHCHFIFEADLWIDHRSPKGLRYSLKTETQKIKGPINISEMEQCIIFQFDTQYNGSRWICFKLLVKKGLSFLIPQNKTTNNKSLWWT